MKAKPANHNILGELDLKNHFLKKLHELRYMKEEYYGQPMEKIDPLDVLAEAEAYRERNFINNSTQMPRAGGGTPWQTDHQGEEQMVASRSIIEDEDTLGEEIEPLAEQAPTNSVLNQYYSR